MFPISDDNSDRRTIPYVNYAIIILNIVVFIVLQGGGSNERFTYAFSCVPQEILNGQDIDHPVSVINDLTGEHSTIDLEPTPISVYITLVTSMFLHGGWAHIFGNMLYLHIFGDNLEDAAGHWKYFWFYMVCGVIASLSHVFATAIAGGNLAVPSLGASGAISAVLGGYILLYPNRRVTVIAARQLMQVPAWVALGIWIVFQLLSSAGALGGQEGGGVAYAAHIGGFIAGLLLIKLFATSRQSRWQ